jgi:hypothetical protein
VTAAAGDPPTVLWQRLIHYRAGIAPAPSTSATI